ASETPQYCHTEPIAGIAGIGTASPPTAWKPAMIGSLAAVSAAALRAGRMLAAWNSSSCTSSEPRKLMGKTAAAALFFDSADRKKPLTPANGWAASAVGLGIGSIATLMPASTAAPTFHGPVSQKAAVPSRKDCLAIAPSMSVLNTPVPVLPWLASHAANS